MDSKDPSEASGFRRALLFFEKPGTQDQGYRKTLDPAKCRERAIFPTCKPLIFRVFIFLKPPNCDLRVYDAPAS
ncbi:MAG TPA: hypothetical protein DCE07_02905 [Peptococcaceae bacterium]|nr:hypothetical protein [Peptococcaceae bacterium]